MIAAAQKKLAQNQLSYITDSSPIEMGVLQIIVDDAEPNRVDLQLNGQFVHR